MLYIYYYYIYIIFVVFILYVLFDFFYKFVLFLGENLFFDMVSYLDEMFKVEIFDFV